jgi:RNase adaptor protein for sRNA GlmZ degradation
VRKKPDKNSEKSQPSEGFSPGSGPKSASSFEDKSPQQGKANSTGKKLVVEISSFGFKSGPPPEANMVFDVRFLQNPFWIDELRDLTGLEKPVQDYVLGQPLAQEFIGACNALLMRLLPQLANSGAESFSIAFGCTGGQHRSVSIAEALARKLQDSCPDYIIRISHRELDEGDAISQDLTSKSSCHAKT